ncbi:Transglutaminase-like superfamily protein [Geodermatophilus telluris]|uniref:Transglutaminase-like superfamily protein n=1 Tax=Geodermatophilus telluris TaxID=1190417 RepID=A0A1G6S828_9ACTN|nr:transglutaminase domain-containing protein [Geodermatophilus telluris]SDD12346.1 Transglutaminase-like superfamily protein [Geodermatophilus telluris]
MTTLAPPPVRTPAPPSRADAAPLPPGTLRRDGGTTLAAAAATALGTCSLGPVFARPAWVPPALAAIAVVAAGGLLLRAAGPALWAWASGGRPAPARVSAVAVPLVPLGQLGLLTCLLTAQFAPGRALGGWLPTPASLDALGRVLLDGSAEIREQSTPALPLTGLLALTVLLVGLVAVTVDLVAVGGRQPALAGLGLLVLFCVPVSTVTGDVGLLALAAPAAGLALLLWADQARRLAERSGRPGTGRGGGTAAVVTAAVALAAGLVLGSLVPTLPEGRLAAGLGPGGGGGGATGTALDPAAALQGQLTLPEPIDLLQVDSSVLDPGYLRVVTLDVYDAEAGWTLGNLDGEASVAQDEDLAPLPGRRGGREVEVAVTAVGHDDRFLPVPTSPLRVRIDDPEAWRFDPATGTVFGRDVTTAGAGYTVTAVEPQPSEEELRAAGPLPADSPLRERDTALPPLDPSVTDLVAALTAGAATPYDAVRAIHDSFSRQNGFVYSLSTAPGTSGDDLADFLRLKQGYCEQYAGAMAAMVRAAGVPARVALGYTPGRVQPGGGRMVTSDDAHAWVEVYFDGLGWIPFDPTPIDTERAVDLPWAPRPADQEVLERPADVPTVPTAPQPAPTPQTDRVDGATPQGEGAAAEAGSARPVLVGAGVLLGLAGLAAAPAGARALQRRRRLADGGPAALWDELAATARDLGLPWDPAHTPRQQAAALAGTVGTGRGHGAGAHRAGASGAAEAVGRLARAEESASYGRPGAPADPALRDALAVARRGLTAAVPVGVRVRAALWPVSLGDAVRAGLAARVPRRRTG